MTAATPTADLLSPYLVPFTALTVDRRTGRLVGDIVRGIIGSGSLVCARIVAFPLAWPMGGIASGGVRRVLTGETTQRSDLDPAALVETLYAHGVAQLRNERQIWVVLDSSDLRTPDATQIEHRWPIADWLAIRRTDCRATPTTRQPTHGGGER